MSDPFRSLRVQGGRLFRVTDTQEVPQVPVSIFDRELAQQGLEPRASRFLLMILV